MARLVADTRIGRVRIVAFEVDKQEFEREKSKVYGELAEYFETMFYDYFKDKEELEKALRDIRSGRKTVSQVLEEHGIEPDFYYSDVEDKVAEKIMTRLLSNYLDRSVKAEASEEPGYGIPEYSLYGSWFGRWWWSGRDLDETAICFGTTLSGAECTALTNYIAGLKAGIGGDKLLFVAYWTERNKD